MRKKRNKGKIIAFILAVIVAFAACWGLAPGPIWAAPNIVGGTVTQKLDAKYAETFKLPNDVKSTLYDKDGGQTIKESTALKNVICLNDDSRANHYVVDLSTAEKGFYVVYEKIGYIGGKYADLKLTFTNWELSPDKWKLHNNVTGAEKTYNPLVSFRKKNGAVSVNIAGVESIKTRFTFLEHGTSKAISTMSGGHFTALDIDDGQGLRFPSDSDADTVYYLKNENFLKLVNGDTLRAPEKQYTTNSDKKAWVSVLFSGTTVKTEFMPSQQSTNIHYYTPNDGSSAVQIPHFGFKAEALGYFEPEVPEKRIGDTKTLYNDAKTYSQATQSKPYEIGGELGTDAFLYQVAAKLLPNEYQEFVISDQIADCLKVEDVKISDMDNQKDVTAKFTVSVKNNLVTASALKTSLASETFYNNKTYVMAITVKRDPSKSMPTKIGSWNLVSNKGSAKYVISNVGTVTKNTKTVWAGFRYQSMEEPEVEKRVGNKNVNWEDAQACGDVESAFRIHEYNEFDFLVRTDVDAQGNTMKKFRITDTLEECLDINSTDQVTVTDKDNRIVTSEFDISITKDETGKKTVAASAKESALQNASFWQNQAYVMHLTVHRKEGDSSVLLEKWMAEDGFTFYIPNTAVISMQAQGEEQEKKVQTNPSYVFDVMKCELNIEKTCASYDGWEVGSLVAYEVKVSQTREGVCGIHVEAWDTDLPEGLKLVWETVQVKESHLDSDSDVDVRPHGENGWKASCPKMQYGDFFVISFQAQADETVNGKDTINTAYATAENFLEGEAKKIVSDEAEVWVNTPQLTIDKYVDRYEHQVGDAVSYTVVINNVKDYTVAKNVVVSDLSLPAGLKLKDENVKVTFSPESAQNTVGWPVADGTQSIQKQGLENRVEVIPDHKNTWTVQSAYLSSDANMTITFDCEATEEINGLETVNQASVTADNLLKDDEGKSVVVWDDAKIYVNTVDLTIDKTASAYEWKVGDTVLYRIEVSSRDCAPGTVARNVVIRDIEIPEGLLLEDVSQVTVNGVPAVVTSPWAGSADITNQLDEDAYGLVQESENQATMESQENGFAVTIPYLPQGELVEIEFPCKAVSVAEGQDGWEWINKASAQADNQRGNQPVEDDAEIYINHANMTLDKTVINPYYQPDSEEYDNREPYEFRVGEQVEYQLIVQNIQKNSIAENVVIADVSLPEGFTLSGDNPVVVEGFQAMWNQPVAGTVDTANQLDENHYREVEQKEFTYSVELQEGENQTTGFVVRMDRLPCTTGDALNPEWNTPIVIKYYCVATEQMNGCEIINLASVSADNAEEKTDNETIWINSPHLEVTKKADRKEYSLGDLITYEIVAAQNQEGCKARNITFADVILTEGVKLQKDSIVLLDESGKLLDKAEYETEIYKDHFTIFTKRDLVFGQSLTVEYQAIAVDEHLAGKTADNQITVDSDEKIPDEDICRVPIQAPVLHIEKLSDKEIYQVGETGTYQLIVTQLCKDAVAEKVTIVDAIEEDGVELVADSIQCRYNGQEFVPFLKATAKGFSIETGKDLTEKDKIEISYQVTFTSPFLNGKQVKNKATAGADNVPEEPEVIHEVQIEIPKETPKPEETPKPKETPKPQETPKPETTSQPVSVAKSPQTSASSSGTTVSAGKTGDERPLVWVAMAVFLAAAGMYTSLYLNRRRTKGRRKKR